MQDLGGVGRTEALEALRGLNCDELGLNLAGNGLRKSDLQDLSKLISKASQVDLSHNFFSKKDAEAELGGCNFKLILNE
jgi:hypothetical protein